MSFLDRLLLIICGIVIGAIVNLLIEPIKALIAERRTINSARRIMPVYANSIQHAITNTCSDEMKKWHDLLLNDYSAIGKNEVLSKDYKKLNEFYLFYHANGYESMPNRREIDINEINMIINKYR